MSRRRAAAAIAIVWACTPMAGAANDNPPHPGYAGGPCSTPYTPIDPGVNQWWAQAVSGYPAQATLVNTAPPISWSNDQNYQGLTNEAAWLVNKFDVNNSLEGGYFTGYWPYDGGFPDYYHYEAYFTTRNGNPGYLHGRDGAGLLTPGHPHALIVRNDGIVTVKDYTTGVYHNFSTAGYVVSAGQNFSQGEVFDSLAISSNYAGTTWMNSGVPGNNLQGWWSNNPGNFSQYYLWGAYQTCSNAPYYISGDSVSNWNNYGK